MQDISARRESLSTFKAKTDMNTPSSGDNAVSQLLGKLDEVSQGLVAHKRLPLQVAEEAVFLES